MKIKMMLLVLISLTMLSFVSAYSDSVYIENYDLSVSYDSAVADDVFTLILEITNDDSEIRNFTLDFDDDDPFEFISDEIWNIEIGIGETISRTFRVEVDEDVDSKSYDLEFNLDDGDDDWNDEFKIKVISNYAELSLGEIISSPNKIIPGSKDVLLEVTLKNTEEITAEDIIATLILPEGFRASGSYSDKVHLGDLNGGESKILTFYFDVNNYLEAESYGAEIELDYEVDGDSELNYLKLDLPIFPIPQFKIIDIQTLSEGIYPGKNSQIKISMKNIGGEDANDVSLKVYERSDQPFLFVEKSVYVGSLGIGQTGFAVFDFDTDKDAGIISYILDFQVRSISGDSVIVDDISTPINVLEKEFNIMDYFVFFVLGGILLIGGISFLAWRS